MSIARMQRPPRAPHPSYSSIENGISMSDGVSNGKCKKEKKCIMLIIERVVRRPSLNWMSCRFLSGRRGNARFSCSTQFRMLSIFQFRTFSQNYSPNMSTCWTCHAVTHLLLTHSQSSKFMLTTFKLRLLYFAFFVLKTLTFHTNILNNGNLLLSFFKTILLVSSVNRCKVKEASRITWELTM